MDARGPLGEDAAMYPYLPGRSAALLLATVMSDRDVADAAARSAAERARHRARRATALAARTAPPEPQTWELHRWLLHRWVLQRATGLHLRRRPPAVP
jgi:hypothetical protein